MLLDNKYTVVPSIKFSLTYDNGVRKVITVKTQDTIDCSYKKNGEKFSIRGVVAKIGCNFNSSLGTVGTTAYLQVDGSSEYSGQVEYIQPCQVLDLTIIKTSNTVENVVCSVDNESQKIMLIRENEVGSFQYTVDGINWKGITAAQGMSAYECAVALGFRGSEKEWLESLKGEPGRPGEAGALEIYKVFDSIAEAENDRNLIPVGKLVAVKGEPSAILLVRNGSSNPCPCPCCNCGTEVSYSSGTVVGYDYLGYLSVGPAGEPGKDGAPGATGKSAYQYAVEGGYIGTEAQFMSDLASSAVAVTNFYMGESTCSLTNSVIGPVDLRIFGYTDEKTFKSKAVSRIDISCPSEVEDQSLIFENPVILRAVPTIHEATRPNLTIGNRKYVADVIMQKDGQVGVYRRIEYIKSYNGETILGDWLSSTGELDMGAEVQYTTYGVFEPFMDNVQSQYRKLHSYGHQTDINVDEDTYISISYPINVTNYINGYVDQRAIELLNEKAPEIIRPIVDDAIDNKQDKLVAGDNIVIDPNTNKISSTASSTITTGFITTKEVGGIPIGTVISVGTTFEQILRDILAPHVPSEEYKVYFGVSTEIPESIDGLTGKSVEENNLILNGIFNRYTANDQRYIYAYPKSTGELVSIKDSSGFENIDGWSFKEIDVDGKAFYMYYTKETLTTTDFKITFIYTDE